MCHLGRKRQNRRPAPDARMAETSRGTASLPWALLCVGMKVTQTQEQTHMLSVIRLASLKVSGSWWGREDHQQANQTEQTQVTQRGLEQFQGALIRLCRGHRSWGPSGHPE